MLQRDFISALPGNVLIWTLYRNRKKLEQYLNLEGFFEKHLKIKYALKSTGKSLKALKSSWFFYFLLDLTLCLEI